MKKLFKKSIILFLLGTTLVVTYNNVYKNKVVLVNKNYKKHVLGLKINKIEELNFKMDSLTEARSINYMQLYNDSKDDSFLTFINNNTNVLYYYLIKDRQVKKTLDLKLFGFDIDNPVQGYYIINDDSLICYTYSDSKLTLINVNKGRVLTKTINQQTSNSDQNVHPFASTRSPILYSKKQNKLYFTGFTSQEGGPYSTDSKRNVVAIFSLTDGSIKHSVQYPEYYWGINWGGAGGLRQAFYDIQNDRIVMSFMASHDIKIFDNKLGKSENRYMGNSKVKSVESMDYSNNILDFLKSSTIYNYYLHTGNYLGIKFDSYREIWYRVAEYPELYEEKLQVHKKKSITISDKNFNTIGEYDLPVNEYDVNQLLISKEGLIIKSQKTSQNELVMECVTFKK